MRRKLPSNAALTAFEIAVRHGSFARAASELAVTGGANDLSSIQRDLTPVPIAQHPDWDLKDMIPMEIQAYYERLCRRDCVCFKSPADSTAHPARIAPAPPARKARSPTLG
jgi:hypothetical protein